jgi:hypothetical protein
MPDADLEGVLDKLRVSKTKPNGADRIQARVVCDGCGDPISQESVDEFTIVVPIE